MLSNLLLPSFNASELLSNVISRACLQYFGQICQVLNYRLSAAGWISKVVVEQVYGAGTTESLRILSRAGCFCASAV